MNPKLQPKTRKEIAQDLGISYSTFWRLLKKKKINLPRGLVYSNSQENIFNLILKEPDDLKEIET
ncbi:MAG: putative DNA-binding protein (UPF0251 family) [Saprospiraceae bacterium]|jgi:predicted DNA-binding protein (UPF0251 family)